MATKKSFKNVSKEIYELNGHLNKVRKLCAKIASDEQVFPKTRDNAKTLQSMLAQIHANFWGPLTWYK